MSQGISITSPIRVQFIACTARSTYYW